MVRQEHSEDNGPNSCIEHVEPQHIFEGQDDDGNDSSHKHYDPKDAEQALALGEVNLSLETEDCDRDTDNSGDAYSQEYSLCAIETGYGSSHIGQGQSKDEKQNDVPGVLSPGPCAADEH